MFTSRENYYSLKTGLTLTLLLFIVVTAQAQTSITFQVNMKLMIENGAFNPEEDVVELTGNVYPLTLTRTSQLEPSENDENIYVTTVEFPVTSQGRQLEYMFRLNSGGQYVREDIPRIVGIGEESTTLDALYFNSYAW